MLKYIVQARDRGLGVIFITHNPHHAYPVGDRFLLLKRGRTLGYYRKERDHPRRAHRRRWPAAPSWRQLTHELESVGGAAADAAHTAGGGAHRSSASAASSAATTA